MMTFGQKSDGLLRRLTRRFGGHATMEPLMQPGTAPLSDGVGTMNRHVSPARIRELMRNVLREAIKTEGPSGSERDEKVRKIVRDACEEARECNEPVEHLLVFLKDALVELPEAHRCSHTEGKAVLGHVITVCIEEYYASRPLS